MIIMATYPGEQIRSHKGVPSSRRKWAYSPIQSFLGNETGSASTACDLQRTITLYLENME
jgi:hypothetical protein